MVTSDARYLGNHYIERIADTLAKFDSDKLLDENTIYDNDIENYRQVLLSLYRVKNYDDNFIVSFLLDSILNHVTGLSEGERMSIYSNVLGAIASHMD